MRNRFLVAQLGARRHYAIPRMLHEAGVLERFYTDICAVKGWPRLLRAVPDGWRPSGLRRLLGRVPHGVPTKKITALTSIGWDYRQARIKAINNDQVTASHIAFGRKFCEAIVRKGLGHATATYTFNSAGLELMQAAKRAGLKTVMEQTIAPVAIELEILAEASSRYLNWNSAVSCGPNIERFVAREEEEWWQADCILCGSKFVSDGIARRGGPVSKCRIVPYGIDGRFIVDRGPRRPGLLRVLTVGEVGLRKGSPVVWQAAEKVGAQVTFRMVGQLGAPTEVLRQKPDNVELVGPIPRSEIFEHYRWADVFLLPSLCEGSATVTYEAMMAGLPVVCTPNTGSIVEHDVSGQIVPPLSPEAVAGALQKWVDCPDFLEECRVGAVRQVPQISLAAYQQRLLKELTNL